MKNSKINFFMSEKQRNIYLSRFSYLNEKNTTILSSVFRQQDLDYIKSKLPATTQIIISK
jgi:hypothetical protein